MQKRALQGPTGEVQGMCDQREQIPLSPQSRCKRIGFFVKRGILTSSLVHYFLTSLLGVLFRHCWAKPGNLFSVPDGRVRVATWNGQYASKCALTRVGRARWKGESRHLEQVMCLRMHSNKVLVCQMEV